MPIKPRTIPAATRAIPPKALLALSDAVRQRLGDAAVVLGTAVDGRVHLVWREVDGPRVRPPTTRGFGLHIIDSLIDYELGGDSRVDFEPTGLVCTLRFREPTPAWAADTA